MAARSLAGGRGCLHNLFQELRFPHEIGPFEPLGQGMHRCEADVMPHALTIRRDKPLQPFGAFRSQLAEAELLQQFGEFR